MKLEYSELDNGIRLIKLVGRLDMDGTNSIDKQFVQHCAGENVFVLVDLSSVNYLSSIGIPMLITRAKAVANRGAEWRSWLRRQMSKLFWISPVFRMRSESIRILRLPKNG